jgi:hypothetical protein
MSLSEIELRAIQRVKDNPLLTKTFVENITGLKWLSPILESGILNPRDIPEPKPSKQEGYVSILKWKVLDYLLNVREELGDPSNKNYAFSVQQFLKESTFYAKENDIHNYHVWSDFTKILTALPIDAIGEEEIELILYWLEDPYDHGMLYIYLKPLVQKLLEEENSNILCEKLILEIIPQMCSSYKENLRHDSRLYNFKNFILPLAFQLGESMGRTVLDLTEREFIKLLEVKTKDEKLSYSIYRPSVADHEQNMKDDLVGLMCSVFRDMAVGYVRSENENGGLYLKELLRRDPIILKRIAIHTLNECFDQAGDDLLEELINQDFLNSYFRNEMWNLLGSHFENFDEQRKKQLLKAIVDFQEREDFKEYSESQIAYQQQIWLTAIKEKYGPANDMYEKCKEITETDPDHPEFSSYCKSGRVIHASDISKDELNNIPISDLATWLDQYQAPKDNFDGPDLEGFLKEFREFIKQDHVFLEIENHLKNFSNSKIYYQYELVRAFSDLVNENKFNSETWERIWRSFISFILEIIEKDSFWESTSEGSGYQMIPNRFWMVGDISKLLELGAEKDKLYTIPDDLYQDVFKIYKIIIEREDSSEFKPDGDFVSITINCPKGKTIQSFLNFMLLLKSKSEDLAECLNLIHNDFDRDDCYDLITNVANFSGNYRYLDNDFTEKVFRESICSPDKRRFRAVIQGFAYSQWFFEDNLVLNLLNDHDLFESIFDDQSLDSYLRNKYVDLATVTFLKGEESFHDHGSMISKLIQRKNAEELNHIIRFLHNHQKVDGVENRVNELWEILLGLEYQTVDDKENVFGQLTHWTDFCKTIDEQWKIRFIKIGPFCDRHYHQSIYFKNLLRFAEENIDKVGEIWERILEHDLAPSADDEIKEILKILISKGGNDRRRAERIVHKYSSHNYPVPLEWLHELTKSRR